MKRKPHPIPQVLELWSRGYAASEIAEVLAMPSHKCVTRIIANARLIKDPRAVLHVYGNGRAVGNRHHALSVLTAIPSLKLVQRVP